MLIKAGAICSQSPEQLCSSGGKTGWFQICCAQIQGQTLVISNCIYIYIYTQYIYMVIDLKVLVKSLNCEDRSCHAGNPRKSFLRVRDFFFAKVGYYESLSLYTWQLVKGHQLLPPGGPAGEWFCTFTFPIIPKVRLRHSQIPWSWSTSLHLPLVLPNVAFWSLKKQTPNAAAKLPKVRLCESQTPRPHGVCFSFDAPPADG